MKALQWFTEDNMKNVVQALNILATFWLAGRGAQMIGALASFAKDIATIKTFRNMNFGTGGINGATGVTSMGSAISQAIADSSGSLATGIVNALTSTTGIISVGIMMMAPTVARLLKGEDPEVEKAKETLNQMTPGLDNKVTNVWQNGKNALHYLAGEKPEEETQAAGKTFWEKWIEWLNNGQKTLDSFGEWLEGKKNVLQEADEYYYDDSWGIQEILDDLERRRQTDTKEGGNSGNADGLTTTDAKDMTGAVRNMPAAVAKALSGLSVRMDGRTVGVIVAPYVSQAIAEQIGG